MTSIRKRWLAPCTAAVVMSVLAAGCSSSSSATPAAASAPPSSSASSNAASSSAAASGASSNVTLAEQKVTQFEAPTTQYGVPSASVSGVSGLKGRTVYYIPLVQFIPGFVVTAATMRQALAKVGMNLQVCNGDANPTAIAGCIQQATGADAAGIILDSIPDPMVTNAISGANAKGVPVIIADQYQPSGYTNTDQLTYVPGVVNQPSQIAWWLIADSQGKANVILQEEADSPSSIQYMTNSLAIYHQYCPACKITLKTITASTSQTLIASDTSSNLLADPSATYYYTEFEDSLQPTLQGIQNSSRSGISLAVAGGSVDGLGLLKSGSSVVKAVVVVDQPYAGWALTDEILRMATKTAPVAEPFPSRLFTTQNIGSISVTTAAQASGVWFGGDSYQSAFEQLWGAG
jgi:ribose transport system substrate-binding protein